MISANVNYYAINPLENPFAQGDEGLEVDQTCPPWNPLGREDSVIKQIGLCDDHVMIADQLPIFRVPFFDKLLKDLPSFWGHVPRWYLPNTPVLYSEIDYDASVAYMIID